MFFFLVFIFVGIEETQMPENPPHPGKTCTACGATPVGIYGNHSRSAQCITCTLKDPSFGHTIQCNFCKKTKLCVAGTNGWNCRYCTDGFPDKAAADKTAADKAAADREAAKDKALVETIPRIEVRLDESLSRVDDAVVSLERSLGQRLAGLEVKLCVIQSDIAALPKGHSDDRLAALQGAIVQMGTELCQVGERMARQEALMARQEEHAQARDANIQALLLRLLQGAGVGDDE